MAQYIWIFSAFSEVPQNRLIFRRDLSHLKNNSRIILLIDITRDRMSVCTDYGVGTKVGYKKTGACLHDMFPFGK